MAKTEKEIVESHTRVLEVFTGKKAEVILKSKEEILLNKLTIAEILKVVEEFNDTQYKIRSFARQGEITYMRKIFFLLCKLGKKTETMIAKFMSDGFNRSYDRRAVYFHVNTGTDMLQNNISFQNKYKQILKEIMNTYSAKMSDR